MKASVLLLSEDGSKHAFDVLLALVKELFRVVLPAVRVNELNYEPLRTASAIGAVTGNLWKSSNPKHHNGQVELVRTIASKISEPDGFVVFHFDGDVPWSKASESVNWIQFLERVVPRVRLVIESAAALQRRTLGPGEVEDLLARMIVLSPFYSIESWCFQNIDHAKRICVQRHRGGHVSQWSAWEKHRALLDELVRPKEQGCFRDAFNRELAVNAFPRIAAAAASTSFAAAALSIALSPLGVALNAVEWGRRY